MMTPRETGDDLVHDIIKKLILQVDGVADASIQRTWDGFHLIVSPKPGQLAVSLQGEIEAILKENFPPSLVLPIEKVATIEGIMRDHVKDKGFVDRLKNDLKHILKK